VDNEFTPKRILIVEDEKHIAEGLKLNLTLQGYQVEIAPDGASALQRWKDWAPDLIVLDIMLPVIDGLSVLRKIRLEDAQLPILILSAKGGSDDKVKGFSFGVDDYLSKPFDLEELLVRVDRLLIRSSWYARDGGMSPSLECDTYAFGNNRIDFTTSTAHCKEGGIRLTDQEARLLKLFIANPGKPLARSRLLEIAWGYTRTTQTRTVDNFIARFRKYFEEDSKNPVYFKSLRSLGYVFNPD
jgi:DNA-binding response OmpR family regulator